MRYPGSAPWKSQSNPSANTFDSEIWTYILTIEPKAPEIELGVEGLPLDPTLLLLGKCPDWKLFSGDTINVRVVWTSVGDDILFLAASSSLLYDAQIRICASEISLADKTQGQGLIVEFLKDSDMVNFGDSSMLA
jgi:hypothetical protein